MMRCMGNRDVRFILLGMLGGVLLMTLWIGGDAMYHHYDLKNRINVYMSRARFKSDLEVRRDLFGMLRAQGVECPEDKIIVRRRGGEIHVGLEYKYPLGIETATARFIVYSMTATVTVDRVLSG